MLTNTRKFKDTRFKQETYQRLLSALAAMTTAYARENAPSGSIPDETDQALSPSIGRMVVDDGRGSSWHHEDSVEFFAELRKPYAISDFTVSGGQISTSLKIPSGGVAHVDIQDFHGETTVIVRAMNRPSVLALINIFEEDSDKSRVKRTEPEPEPEPEPKPLIFIGHGGHSKQWRDLKDHLTDMHDYDVEAFESGARAGHAIRDILDDMLDDSTFAILVMTAEDEMAAEDGEANGKMRARQNVVHEAGLFQGRLGFARAVILLEQGTEDFSNIDGVQHIRFQKDNIRETFGDVLGTLRREFPS